MWPFKKKPNPPMSIYDAVTIIARANQPHDERKRTLGQIASVLLTDSIEVPLLCEGAIGAHCATHIPRLQEAFTELRRWHKRLESAGVRCG